MSNGAVVHLPAPALPRYGTAAAWPVEDVYRSLAPPVLGYFRAHRAPDPEDLCAEVFLQVARDFRRFRGDDDDLRRWVFTIAHHRLVDDRRRRAVRPRIVDRDIPEHAVGADHGDALDPQLIRALKRLTAAQREVVVLRFVADLPLRAVARITRRRIGAVKQLQARGLEALARDLTGS